MKQIWENAFPTHDEYANMTGFIQTETIIFYDEDDIMVPGNENQYPVAPCLVYEILDEDSSSHFGEQFMKVISWIKLTKKQAQFFKNIKSIKNEELVID